MQCGLIVPQDEEDNLQLGLQPLGSAGLVQVNLGHEYSSYSLVFAFRLLLMRVNIISYDKLVFVTFQFL